MSHVHTSHRNTRQEVEDKARIARVVEKLRGAHGGARSRAVKLYESKQAVSTAEQCAPRYFNQKVICTGWSSGKGGANSSAWLTPARFASAGAEAFASAPSGIVQLSKHLPPNLSFGGAGYGLSHGIPYDVIIQTVVAH